MKLHFVKDGKIIPITGEAKNLNELRPVFETKAYELFRKLPDVIKASSSSVAVSSSSLTSSVYPPFIDERDGKEYKAVKIGEQVWMAENLNYNAGGSRCYKNQESVCQKCGRLYDWNTARRICPSGWHLPSNDEWDDLIINVNPSCPKVTRPRATTCSNGSTLLKATWGWENRRNGKDDRYGFSALPCGYSYGYGDFGGEGRGEYWSANARDDIFAYSREINWSDVISDIKSKTGNFYSVRCLKD